MSEISNEYLAELVCGPHGRSISVSMSKDGAFLRVGAEHHKITLDQAEIVWEAMQEMMSSAVPRPERGGES